MSGPYSCHLPNAEIPPVLQPPPRYRQPGPYLRHPLLYPNQHCRPMGAAIPIPYVQNGPQALCYLRHTRVRRLQRDTKRPPNTISPNVCTEIRVRSSVWTNVTFEGGSSHEAAIGSPQAETFCSEAVARP